MLDSLKLTEVGPIRAIEWDLSQRLNLIFPYLERRAPFLASELKRLDLIEKIREMMLF